MKYLLPAAIGFVFTFCLTSLILKTTFNIDIVKAKNTEQYHPKIQNEYEIYQIHLNDSVSDVCYDKRHKSVVIIDGIFIEERCHLDSNRYHFNIKNK